MNLRSNTQPRVGIRKLTSLGNPQRVFVVEDDDATREHIVDELVADGHEVVSVENGAQLLDCLRIVAHDGLRAPDLIAMDVKMPGRSGIELLESLRFAGWATPVVLFTSFVSYDLRFRAEVAGSADVIQKPFSLKQLSIAAWRARTRKDSFIPCERRWFHRRFAS